MPVRVQPEQPIPSARVAQIIERDASNIEDEGETPSASANFQGVMSVADGLAWNEEDGSAILSTLTILEGRQIDGGCPQGPAPVPKQDRHCAEVGALPMPSASLRSNAARASLQRQSKTKANHRGSHSASARQANVLTLNERRSHEARSSISKPIALSQELQTKSSAPSHAGEIEFSFSPGAFRSETKNYNL